MFMIEFLLMLPIYLFIGIVGIGILVLVTFPILFFLYYLFIEHDFNGMVASVIVAVILYAPTAAFVIYCINHQIVG